MSLSPHRDFYIGQFLQDNFDSLDQDWCLVINHVLDKIGDVYELPDAFPVSEYAKPLYGAKRIPKKLAESWPVRMKRGYYGFLDGTSYIREVNIHTPHICMLNSSPRCRKIYLGEDLIKKHFEQDHTSLTYGEFRISFDCWNMATGLFPRGETSYIQSWNNPN